MSRIMFLSSYLKKLWTFAILLVILLLANLIFILKFNWLGISIIVNVYLYVFSFYFIFVFSLIDIASLKKSYLIKYEKFGIYRLFLKTRVFPFAVIYGVTVVYTLINYLSIENWPWRPMLELLDGRYSSIVFYSLILLVILKIKRDIRIIVPLFLGVAVIYFALYQFVFKFDPSGLFFSMLKFLQISGGLFFLIYEFMSDRRMILFALVNSIAMGILIYLFFLGATYMLMKFSPTPSFQQAKAAQILMRMGYSFPLEKYRQNVIETSNPYLLYDLIIYSDRYEGGLQLSSAKWESLLFSSSMEVANVISLYLAQKDIEVSYNQVMSFAERRSIDAGEALINSAYFSSYVARYYERNIDDFELSFQRGNKDFKIWLVRVISESKSVKAVPFLMNVLTGVDYQLSQEAYNALARICGVDPMKDLKSSRNSLDSLKAFYEVYTQTDIGR